jgi:hypothetical protein
VKFFKIGTAADNPELSAAGHLQRFKNCNLYQFRTVADDLICSSVSDDDDQEESGRKGGAWNLHKVGGTVHG